VETKFGFLVGGTHSGCGKTTIALALMAAFKARGLRVQPFKVGPDFIDPGFHTQITGFESRNLDGWMLGREYNRALFRRLLERADMAIVEGVMGLFDGYDGVTESGSSAEMAKWLGLPVILVVDARSMARSAAALVHGFSHFDPKLNFAGVIFNRIGSEGHLDYLKEAMAANLPGIPVLGGVPGEEVIRIPERHLGLVTADEISIDSEWEKNLAGLVERYVDLDLILRMAAYERGGSGGSGESLKTWIPAFAGMTPEDDQGIVGRPHPDPPPSRGRREGVCIAVARDAAFCFYYPDNFELLEQAGAQLHLFSPLAGEGFPEDSAGLYLGGGYPELYGEILASRKDFLAAIRCAVHQKMPVYAECGGLMVLSRFIETLDKKRHRMAGLLPFGTRMLPRRKALGYTEVVLQESCLLGKRDMAIRGHEFHYSEIVEEEADPAPVFVYRIHGRKFGTDRPEGYMVGSVLASYVHLHWGSAPEAAASFVGRCREYRGGVK
jgi:cobyrinic acid a,c-diamide synthase